MLDPRFQRVETEYRRLRGELEAGRITADTFERQLDALTFEVGGHFWIIGANSGKWYRSEGTSWVEAAAPQMEAKPTVPLPPPKAVVDSFAPPPQYLPPQPPAPKKSDPRTFFFGCGLGCLAPIILLAGLAWNVWAAMNEMWVAPFPANPLVSLGAAIFTASLFALARRLPILLGILGGIVLAGVAFFGGRYGLFYFGFDWARPLLGFGLGSTIGAVLALLLRKI